MKFFVFALLIVAVTAAPSGSDRPELVKYHNDVSDFPTKWDFGYEIKDAPEPQEHSRQETGGVKQIGDEVGATFTGSYSFISPEGQLFTVNYIADENGFRPVGDHIPT